MTHGPRFPQAVLEPEVSQLAAAIEALSQNVRVLTDLVEHTRSELQWIAQNGIPHQTLTVRLLPATDTAGTAKQVEVVETWPSPSDAPATADDLQQLFEWLAEHMTALQKEQLNQILTAQEDVKRHVVAAIRGESPGKSHYSVPTLLPTETSPATGTATQLPKTAAPPSPRSEEPRPAPGNLPASRWLLFDDAEPTEQKADDHSIPAVPTKTAPTETNALPPVSSWEIGDAVEFSVDEREVWGEIVELDDATNSATVQLIPSDEEVTVSQDIVRREEHATGCGCIDPLSSAAGDARSSQPSSREAPTAPTRSASELPDPSETVANESLLSAPATGTFSLARFAQVLNRLRQGTITAKELRDELNWLLIDRDEFCRGLTKRFKRGQLRALAVTLGYPIETRQMTKENLAATCFHRLVRTFALDADISWDPATETYEGAAMGAAERLTEDDLQAYAARTDHVERPLGMFLSLLHGK
jgi:hypothetical protein